MSLYNPTIAMPAHLKVVNWAFDVLKASSALQNETLLGGGEIYAHEHPIEMPDRILVVRQEVQAGGSFDVLGGRSAVKIQVMSMCDESLYRDIRHIQAWHVQVQGRVAEELVGKIPPLDDFYSTLPFRRIRKPSRAMYEDASGTYFTTSTFEQSVRPQ